MQSAALHQTVKKPTRLQFSLSDIARILDVPVVIAAYRDINNVRNHSTFGLDFGVNWSGFADAVDTQCANGATIIPNIELHPELGPRCAALIASNIRFFAGVPLCDFDGWRVGSIAVLAAQGDVARKGIPIRRLGELGREFVGVAPKMEAAGAGRLMR
jgi:hypothetical protein